MDHWHWLCMVFIEVLVVDNLSVNCPLVGVQMKKKLKVTESEAIQWLEDAWEELADHIRYQATFWQSQANLAKEFSDQEKCSYYTARYKTYMNVLTEVEQRLSWVRYEIYGEDE